MAHAPQHGFPHWVPLCTILPVAPGSLTRKSIPNVSPATEMTPGVHMVYSRLLVTLSLALAWFNGHTITKHGKEVADGIGHIPTSSAILHLRAHGKEPVQKMRFI